MLTTTVFLAANTLTHTPPIKKGMFVVINHPRGKKEIGQVTGESRDGRCWRVRKLRNATSDAYAKEFIQLP